MIPTIPAKKVQDCTLYELIQGRPPAAQNAGLMQIGEEGLVRVVVFLQGYDEKELCKNFCSLSQVSKYFFMFSRTVPGPLEGLRYPEKTVLFKFAFLQPLMNVATLYFEQGCAEWHNVKLRGESREEINLCNINAKINKSEIYFCNSLDSRSQTPFHKVNHLKEVITIFNNVYASGFFSRFQMLNQFTMDPFFSAQAQRIFDKIVSDKVEVFIANIDDFCFHAASRSRLPWDDFSEDLASLLQHKNRLSLAVGPSLSVAIQQIDSGKTLRNCLIQKFSVENLKFIGAKFLTRSYCKERKEAFISREKEKLLTKIAAFRTEISEQNLYAEDLYDVQCGYFRDLHLHLKSLSQLDTELGPILDRIHSKAAKFFLELSIPVTEENLMERVQSMGDILNS